MKTAVRNSAPRQCGTVTTAGMAIASLCLVCAQPAIAGPGTGSQSDVFRSFSANRWILREITFADLGFTGPLVLGAPETQREIYLPVPANVALSNGEIKLDASYMRGDGGRTTLVASLDTYPVSSRPFALEKGDASVVLAVGPAARPSGFVRLGLDWNTSQGADWKCADGRSVGNILRIEPDSRFSYRYDGSAIRDLATAWTALPAQPVILISSRRLDTQTYDSAWRLGLALERAGKLAVYKALPAIGDVIDLEGVAIPAGLLGVPAFAALAHGDKYTLKDEAEVGALLSLGQSGPVHADLMLSDPAMAQALAAAFDALQKQLSNPSPAYADWRSHGLDSLSRAAASKEILLAWELGRPTIVIAADAGAQAAGLFGSYWNRVAAGSALVVQAAGVPIGDTAAISLSYLGGKPGSFDVLAHGDWNTSFDIGAVAADGRVPDTLFLDVAAAPSAGRTPPVVSVFMNDILLGARQMDANGKRERVIAPIPHYSLAASNMLRVSFVRQLSIDRCRETPEPYPVSVLPSSYMSLKTASPTDDFNGMVSRFAGGANVMVPATFLADSPRSLARVVRLAAATGVSPANARFTAVTGTAMPAPGGAFLAVELPVAEGLSKIKTSAGHLVMTANGGNAVLDLSGLDRVAVLEVVKADGATGVMYHNVGAEPPGMDKAILLTQGDIAILGANGVLREINSADPSGSNAVGEERTPWLLSRGYWWMVPIVVIVFMIALLVFASRVRRRKAAEKKTSA
jgi:hypothetical protein